MGASLNWKFSRKCEISSPCKMLIAYYFVEFLYISCNIDVLRASINPYSRKCQKGGNNVSGFAFSCVTLKALLLLDSFPLSSFVGGLDCCKEVIVAHDMNPPIHIRLMCNRVEIRSLMMIPFEKNSNMNDPFVDLICILCIINLFYLCIYINIFLFGTRL